MSLLQELARLINEADGLSSHLLESQSLKAALQHLDNVSEELKALKGKTQPDDAFGAWGVPFIGFEQRSKNEDGDKPWRFVFDAPKAEGVYIEDPVVQICSGEPDYHRFMMTFTANGIQLSFDTKCIDSNPDLSQIQSKDTMGANHIPYLHSQVYMEQLSLETRKKQDEDSGIQRIAILGAARVFIHGLEASEDHKKLTEHVQLQCNRFLDVFEDARGLSAQQEEPTGPFRTVNGGWAGKLEGSTGLPLISNLMGVIEDQKFKREPITVMPSSGAYDHVEGVGRANYFEVPGTWGDDSKYLIGFSSAVIVFEPYGFWTGIELRNALAQNKPVVVVRGPNEPKQAMEEVTVPLPNGAQGTYRRYSNLADGAEWIRRCWNVRFIDTFLQQHALPELNILRERYIAKEINFKALVPQVLSIIPLDEQDEFKLSMVKQHGAAINLLEQKDKKNPVFAFAAVQQNPEALQFVSPCLFKNEQLKVLATLRWTPDRMQQGQHSLQDYFSDPLNDLKAKLYDYQEHRKQNIKEYYHGSFFRLFGAYSRTEKLSAVEALITFLEGEPGVELTKEHFGALKQGELGKLIANWERVSGRTIEQNMPQPQFF